MIHVKKKKKKDCATSLKRNQLRHIYAAQSHATMTTQQRLEGPQHHLSSLSLIGAKKKRITLLSQVRSHVLEHDRFTLVRVFLPLASQDMNGNERKVKL